MSAIAPIATPQKRALSRGVQLLRFAAVLLSGMVVGAAFALALVNANSIAFEKALLVTSGGLVAALGAYLLFRLGANWAASGLRSIVTPAAASAFVESIRQLFDPSTNAAQRSIARQQIADRAKVLLEEGTHLIAAIVSSAASIGLAIAILGSVISVAAVVAAYHQVARMDKQNELVTDQNTLIERQIFESKATRISQIFSSQLPSLLSDIANARKAAGNRDWLIGDELFARIQALIYATQPYMSDESARNIRASLARGRDGAPTAIVSNNESRVVGELYSPERGQLLTILVAMRFPFSTLKRPLDFSNADLRGMALGEGRRIGPAQMLSLGGTILKGANMFDTEIGAVDFSGCDLRKAILPSLRSDGAIFHKKIGDGRTETGYLDFLQGANLEGVLTGFVIPHGGGRFSVPGSNRHFWVARPIKSLAFVRGMTLVPQQASPDGWGQINQSSFIVSKQDQNAAFFRALQSELTRIGSLSIDRQSCRESSALWFAQLKNQYVGLDREFQHYVAAFLDNYGSSVADCFFSTDQLAEIRTTVKERLRRGESVE